MAALYGCLPGPGGELPVGQSRLRGPIEHDPGSGAYRVEVRLARGPLRPLLRMRLTVDCWSCSPPGSALVPCGRVQLRQATSGPATSY